MKGFVTDFGYVGLINGKYQIFACESEYIAAYRETEGENGKEKSS